MVLTLAHRVFIQKLINRIERGGGVLNGVVDQTTSDELRRIFGPECSFVCGCPGSFAQGLQDTPITTLLAALLCAAGPIISAGEGAGPAGDVTDELLEATGFGILGATTVTNTGPTLVTGDLGLSPGTSVTGFFPIDGGPGNITGAYHITDGAAAQAQLDLTTAYLDLEGRPGGTTVAGNIGGQTFAPGIYKSASSLDISSGEVTLDALGNADAVFLFQIASALTVTSGRQVILAGGAQAKNVFWQVGSSATLGTTSVFKGSILALTSISALTGAQIEGRLLARNGAVTLDTNNVVVPV